MALVTVPLTKPTINKIGVTKMANPKNIERATHRLLDTVWVMEFEYVLGGVYLHRYDRTNQLGYEQEAELMKASIKENNDRQATHIVLRAGSENESELVIVNSRHIFDYSQS